MFVRTKIIAGKKRRYLVESYRDEKADKIRQRHLAYVDLWPTRAIAKLAKLYERYNKAMADSQWAGKDERKTESFMRQAKANAGKIQIQISNFKRAMAIEVTPRRKRVDRRIKGERYICHRIPAYNKLFYCLQKHKFSIILDQLAEDYGPVAGWSAESKDSVRLQIEPFKKLFDKLWADLQV